jgi:hypothetical protein
MLAHRIRITIPENHEVTVRLPSEVPPGEAEMIVLTDESPEPRAVLSFDERFPRDPGLSRIVFHEDPTAPVSEDDWPSEQRP